MNKPVLFAALLFCIGIQGFALDYGVALNQFPLVRSGGSEGEGDFDYSLMVRPWLSSPLGEKADLYLSGGFSAEYGEEWAFLPDVSRFEISLRPLPNLGIEAGRFNFTEALGFVFSGLFDGLGAAWDIGGTRLEAGAFYTGLLYKKTAGITMTPQDGAAYSDKEVYFASRRVVLALNWRIPALFDSRNSLDLSALAQIDLNDTEYALHSQYILAKWSRPLGGGWYMDMGAAAMVEEVRVEGGDDKSAAGFALSLEPFWVPRKRPGDRLSFTFRMASGNRNDTLRAFRPLTTQAQGKVLEGLFSGLAWAQAAYRLGLPKNLRGELSAAWFFRTDRETYAGPGLKAGSSSPSLGGEAYASLSWVPASWCSLTLGGGVFVPHSGGAYDAEAALTWRAAAGLVLSF
ncbi:MAG: hypothetical protein LBP32_00490 [Spirochaetaceae bacterium]|jgi:hypothetical protein|nr:hypothetical protein [Spirochaetaceae bacterium]